MKHKWTKATLFALTVFLGTSLTAEAEISLPLQPGYAVHTMGVSPDAGSGDDYAVLRIYDTHKRIYRDYDNTAWDAKRPVGDFGQTGTYDDWTIEKLGNVYGIAIDKDKNIYVTASANWSPGYTGEGISDTAQVPVRYGDIGGGENNLSAAGTVYKIDGTSGTAEPFAVLPQDEMTIAHQVCGRPNTKVIRHTGPGLGNIVYDKFHHQFFVSNFSDGKIYRVAEDGTIEADTFDTSLGGVTSNGSAYGLAISSRGDKLFFGTIEIGDHSYKPGIFSVALNLDGSFKGHTPLDAVAHARLIDDLPYTQDIGGSGVDNGVWAAFSDLAFTPDGELMAGVRVGCENNFATSYNHGGVVYLLQKNDDGKYNKPSSKTTPSDEQETTYSADPIGTNDATERTGHSDKDRYDAGSIPLRFKDGATQNQLDYGPDDGYGGVAVWQDENGTYDLYATSSDISTEIGVHGFMQFDGNFTITDKATLDRAAGFKAVKSSITEVNNENKKFDYKGIGGDVEVLSVVPVSIGSCVWLDKNKNGIQDDGDDSALGGVELALYDKAGHKVATTTTNNDCIYQFTDLAEGDYRVCVTGGIPVSSNNTFRYLPTKTLSTGDNNDSENDSNFVDGNCSGYYSLFVGTEPTESGDYRGDNQDNSHDTWGNMTVDFGYVKHWFDLALKKELVGDPDHKYKIGETVQFKITVKNQGNVDATNVVVKDTLPKGLELNDSRWSDDGTFTIASIKADKEAVVEINCTVTGEAGEQGSLINIAEIADAHNPYDLNDTDSVPGKNPCGTDMNNDDDYDGNTTGGCDDVDPAVITIKQHFDLALIKKVKGTKAKYKPGEKVTFVIAVYNQGTITGKDIQIKDDIPEGLELVDDNWILSGKNAVLKIPIASLAPGAYATREIVFKIKDDFNGTKITNIAEIEKAVNDLNLTDDDSRPGDNPCNTDIKNNNDINSTQGNANGCDDVDPAWITIATPLTVNATPESVSGSSVAEEACDCAGVQGNKVDAVSTWMIVLMIFGIVMIGFLQSRERTAE